MSKVLFFRRTRSSRIFIAVTCLFFSLIGVCASAYGEIPVEDLLIQPRVIGSSVAPLGDINEDDYPDFVYRGLIDVSVGLTEEALAGTYVNVGTPKRSIRGNQIQITNRRVGSNLNGFPLLKPDDGFGLSMQWERPLMILARPTVERCTS